MAENLYTVDVDFEIMDVEGQIRDVASALAGQIRDVASALAARRIFHRGWNMSLVYFLVQRKFC